MAPLSKKEVLKLTPTPTTDKTLSDKPQIVENENEIIINKNLFDGPRRKLIYTLSVNTDPDNHTITIIPEETSKITKNEINDIDIKNQTKIKKNKNHLRGITAIILSAIMMG
ncbi:7565_t:CDS:1, partial [Scutellospora calospora]